MSMNVRLCHAGAALWAKLSLSRSPVAVMSAPEARQAADASRFASHGPQRRTTTPVVSLLGHSPLRAISQTRSHELLPAAAGSTEK
eukprot:scaffold613_cov79-Phaeocystis_antarctica.AAC.17